MSTSIPPGVDLNDDRSPQLIRSVVACCVLSGLAFVGRLASRKIQKSNFLASDYFVAVGLVGSWVVSGITIDAASLGLGKHIEVVPLRHVELILRNVVLVTIFYGVTQMPVKISILLFYREIFVGKKFLILTNIIGAFVLAWLLASEVVSCLNCRPFKGMWDVTLDPPARCTDQKAAYIWLSFLSMIADVAILCLPVGKVWQLQMSIRLKVAVAGMFLLGGFVTVVSLIRLVLLVRQGKDDITWNYYDGYLWTCVEVNIAVVSACLPIFRPLVRKIYPAAFVSRILGSQTSKDAMVNVGVSSHTFGRSPRSEHGEELQRLPDHAPEAMPGWHTSEAHCAPVPKLQVDGFDFGGVAEPHDGIAVHKSFSTC